MKISKANLDSSPIMKAIVLLDRKMKEMNCPPLELNIVGGFALIVKGIRKDVKQVTDVDYIGDDLPPEIKEIADKIGIQCGIGRGWLNNDLMLTGTSFEDIEYATGKLHFKDQMDLSVIRMRFLDDVDLLRMKLISLDTSLSAVEFGGDFSRMKDLRDIIRLKEYLHLDYIQMEEIAEDYLLEPDLVFDAISAFEIGDSEQVMRFVNEIANTKEEICDIENILKNETELELF